MSVDYLLPESIQKASYASRLYLWGIQKYGAKPTADALKSMLSTIAVVAIFDAAFVNIDLPDRVLLPENALLIRMFGICGTFAQLLAIVTVIMSVLLYVQLGFYDADDAYEVSFFVTKFGTFTAFPIGTMIASLMLGIIAVNTRCALQYEGAVWVSAAVFSGALGLPCLLAYPIMDPMLRNLRQEQANLKLRTSASSAWAQMTYGETTDDRSASP